MKTQINFKFTQQTKDRLRDLSKKEKLSQAVILEKLIDERYLLVNLG